MASDLLTRISIPSLNKADFGAQFRKQLENIDLNFQKIANSGLFKGHDGKSCVYFTINLAAPFVYGTSDANSNDEPIDTNAWNIWERDAIPLIAQTIPGRWNEIVNDVEADYKIYNSLTGLGKSTYAALASYLLWGYYRMFTYKGTVPAENSITGAVQKKYGTGTDPIRVQDNDGRERTLYGNWLYEFFTTGVENNGDIADVKALATLFMDHVSMVPPGKISIAMSPDLEGGQYRPVGSLAYWYMDPRFAVSNIRSANEKVTDVSCVIQWTPNNTTDIWSGQFNIVTSFPTIELGNDGKYYWVVNGINTGISPQGIPGKDGTAASFVVVERIENVTGYDPVTAPAGTGLTGPYDPTTAHTLEYDSYGYSGNASRYETRADFRAADGDALVLQNAGVTAVEVDGQLKYRLSIPKNAGWLPGNVDENVKRDVGNDPQHFFRIYRIVGGTKFFIPKKGATPVVTNDYLNHIGDPSCDKYYFDQNDVSTIDTSTDVQTLINSLNGSPAVVIPGPAFSQDRTDTTFWLSTLRAVATDAAGTGLMLIAYCGEDGQMTTNVDGHTFAGMMQRLDAYSFKKPGDNRLKPRGLMLPIGSALADSSTDSDIWAAHIMHSDLGGFTGITTSQGKRYGVQQSTTEYERTTPVASSARQFTEVVNKRVLHIGSVNDYRSLSYVSNDQNNRNNAGVPGRKPFNGLTGREWDSSFFPGSELHVDEPVTITGYRDLLAARLLLSVEGDTIIGPRRHINYPGATWNRASGGMYIGSYPSTSTIDKIKGVAKIPFAKHTHIALNYPYGFTTNIIGSGCVRMTSTLDDDNVNDYGINTDQSTTKHILGLITEYGIGSKLLLATEGFAICSELNDSGVGSPVFSVDRAGNVQTMGREIRSNAEATDWFLHTNWGSEELFTYPNSEIELGTADQNLPLKTDVWYWITCIGLSDDRANKVLGYVNEDPYSYAKIVNGSANPYLVDSTGYVEEFAVEHKTIRLYRKPTTVSTTSDDIVNWLLWRVEPDPAGSGRFALINKLHPEGSLSPIPAIKINDPNASAAWQRQKRRFRWCYDENTKHYAFDIIDGAVYLNGDNTYGLNDAVANGTNPKPGVLALTMQSTSIISNVYDNTFNGTAPTSPRSPFYPILHFMDSREGFAIDLAEAADVNRTEQNSLYRINVQSIKMYFAPVNISQTLSDPSAPENNPANYNKYAWSTGAVISKPGRALAYGNSKEATIPPERDYKKLWRANNRQPILGGDTGFDMVSHVEDTPIGWTIYQGFYKLENSALVPTTAFHGNSPQKFTSGDYLPTVIKEFADVRHQVGALSVAGIQPTAVKLIDDVVGEANENGDTIYPRGRFGIHAAYGIFIEGPAREIIHMPSSGSLSHNNYFGVADEKILRWTYDPHRSVWTNDNLPPDNRGNIWDGERIAPETGADYVNKLGFFAKCGGYFRGSLNVGNHLFVDQSLYTGNASVRGYLRVNDNIRGNGNLGILGNGTFGGNVVVKNWLAIGRLSRQGNYDLSVSTGGVYTSGPSAAKLFKRNNATTQPAFLLDDGTSTTHAAYVNANVNNVPLPVAANGSVIEAPLYMDYGDFYGSQRLAPFGKAYVNSNGTALTLTAPTSADYKTVLVCSSPTKNTASRKIGNLFKGRNNYRTEVTISSVSSVVKLDVKIRVDDLIRSDEYHKGRTWFSAFGVRNSNKHYTFAYGIATAGAPRSDAANFNPNASVHTAGGQKFQIEGAPAYPTISTINSALPTAVYMAEGNTIRCNGIDWEDLYTNIPKPPVEQWFFVGSLYRGNNGKGDDGHNWYSSGTDRSFQKGLWFRLGTDGKLTIPYWNEAGSLFNCRTWVTLSFVWTAQAASDAMGYKFRRRASATVINNSTGVQLTVEPNPWGTDWSKKDNNPKYYKVLEYASVTRKGTTWTDPGPNDWIVLDQVVTSNTTYWWVNRNCGWDGDGDPGVANRQQATNIDETNLETNTPPNNTYTVLAKHAEYQEGLDNPINDWGYIFDYYEAENTDDNANVNLSSNSNLMFIKRDITANSQLDRKRMNAYDIWDWIHTSGRGAFYDALCERVKSDLWTYEPMITIYDNYGYATLSHVKQDETWVHMHIFCDFANTEDVEYDGLTGSWATVTFRVLHSIDEQAPMQIRGARFNDVLTDVPNYPVYGTMSLDPTIELTDEYNVYVDATATNSVVGYLGIPYSAGATSRDTEGIAAAQSRGTLYALSLPTKDNEYKYEYDVKYQGANGVYYIDVLVVENDVLKVKSMTLSEFAANFNKITIVAEAKPK